MPSGLQIADHQVGAVIGRRRQHAEGDRVDACDQHGAGLVGDIGNRRGLGLDEAEIAGALDHHRCGLARDLGAEVGKVGAPRRGIACDGLHGRHRLGEAPQLRAPVGAHGLRHEHAAPPADAAGHQSCAAGRSTCVIGGGRDHLHPHQLAHQALKFEERLVLAVVGIGAAAVGREQLAAVDDLVHDRRHVVLGTAGAAEVEPCPGAGPVAGDDLLEMPAQVLLARKRRRQVEQTLDPERLRDCGIEIRHVAGSDRLQKLSPRRRCRVRHVGMNKNRRP